jgi:ribonuclease VapC
MVIDPSALIAILSDEPERRAFTEAIERADSRLLSAAGFVETSIIIENKHGYDGRRDLDLLIAGAGIEIVEVDEDQARFARDAFRRYGKCRHAAGLNFGDCFSYALAKVTGLPLLFKGNDFAQTDIPPVPILPTSTEVA